MVFLSPCSSAFFENHLQEFMVPEIERVPLEDVLLQVRTPNLASIAIIIIIQIN